MKCVPKRKKRKKDRKIKEEEKRILLSTLEVNNIVK